MRESVGHKKLVRAYGGGIEEDVLHSVRHELARLNLSAMVWYA